ncbi:hypothetical protein ScPMuIL_004612 [Solemya velum]
MLSCEFITLDMIVYHNQAIPPPRAVQENGWRRVAFVVTDERKSMETKSSLQNKMLIWHDHIKDALN